jgi:uncharacterized Tic20 family protein
VNIPPSGSDIPPTAPPPGNWPPPPSGSISETDGISQDDRTMAMLAYVLGIFTGFLGPLVIWLIKKDQSKFVAYHGLQALLFHAVILVGYILSSFLVVFLIEFLTYPLFGILSLVYSILAGLAASRGEWYEIPVVGKFTRQQVGV